MGLFGFSALCLFLTLCVQPGDLACTFPFTGTWVTSNRGTWTVTSNTTENFKLRVDVASDSLWTMECFSTDGTYYILKSTGIFYPFTTVPTYIYTCMTFSKQSDNKYLYTVNTVEYAVVTNPSKVYERVILKSTSAPAPAQSEVCTDTTNLGIERDHVALQSGFEVAAAITCPTSIHGTWSYSYSGLTCSSTTLDTCSDKTKFAYNNTVCVENPMFSSGGSLYCVYSATSGDSTYVTLYNVDGSVTNPTTFQFSCMVYTTSGSSISASVNPEACATGQTSTSIGTEYGKTVTFADIATTACYPTTPTSETDLTWLYILIGVLLFIIIVLIIIIILCIVCRRRKRTQIDDEERNITEESDDDKSTKSEEQAQNEPEELRHEEEKEPPSEETKQDEEEDEDDRASQDSGFIPDKLDKEEQQKENEEKKEEEVRVEVDGQTKEDQERPDTVISKMSDLGSTIAPSEQVDGATPLPSQVIVDEERDEQKDPTPRDLEEEENNEQRHESQSSESSEDEEEVQRRIREIGGRKQGHGYVPEGQLSKVLITRDMHEKKRNKKQRKLGRFARGKSKQKHDKRKDGGGSPDSLEEEELRKNGDGKKAEFMEQYLNKKRIETKLDEEHYWSEEDDHAEFKMEDYDDDFEESFPKENNKAEEEMVVENVDEPDDTGKPKADGTEKEREKDSGTDSPGFRVTPPGGEDDKNGGNIDSDQDLRDVEEDEVFDEEYVKGISKLPPGFVRDSQGRIIRVSDGQIISEEEMARYYKKARIRGLFKIQRLKRNKKGRPTGGYIADEFGPEITQTQKEESKDGDGEDGPRPKQPRSSADRIGTSERRQRPSLTKVDNTGGKSVAFNVGQHQEEEEVITFGDDDDDVKRKGRRDVGTPSRELLKKRLFKSRKKRDPQMIYVSESEKPRELNDLVKVYGRGGGGAPLGGPSGRPPLPPSSLQRNDSTRNSLNPEQLRQFRLGLANDQKFLDQRKGGGDRHVREAFTTPNDLEIEEIQMDDEERRSIDIGDEDEFVLVGNRTQGRPEGYQNSPEPFFTIVRRSGERINQEQTPPWCTRHELRHTIPWSLREPSSMTRANTMVNDSGESMRSLGASKSADAKKRNMDDWRLRILLEELYKDKKYFDHVIDSTDREKDPILDERDLAEHGRGYLLNRAEYWDQQMRDNPMPIPPWCVPSRVNTSMKLNSGRGSQTSTVTPPIYGSPPPSLNVPNEPQDTP